MRSGQWGGLSSVFLRLARGGFFFPALAFSAQRPELGCASPW